MLIISGGEYGPSMGALKGVEMYNKKYKISGVSTGGYAPKGWVTEKGIDRGTLKYYGLKQDTPTPGFSIGKSRNIRNVNMADIIIAILPFKDISTICTCWYALHGEYYNRFTIPLKDGYKTDKGGFIPNKFISCVEGYKPIIILHPDIEDDNIRKECCKSLAEKLKVGEYRRIMFIGPRESKCNLQKYTKYLVFEMLKTIYGKS